MARPCRDIRNAFDARWRRPTTVKKTADLREKEARSLADLVASGSLTRAALGRRTDPIAARALAILDGAK